MNERSIFHLISDVTHKEGVPCVLIGGFAVNFHKVTRQTADVDFLTRNSPPLEAGMRVSRPRQ